MNFSSPKSKIVHNSAMKQRLILLILLPLLAAWTLEIDIGSATIGANRSEQINIRATSDNGLDWQIHAQAPRLSTPQGTWRNLQAQSALHYRKGQWQLMAPQISAHSGKNSLTFSSPQFLPLSPLSLHIRSPKAEILSLNWQPKSRELLLQKPLNASALNELLQFLHLPLLNNFDGELKPNLRLKQQGNTWQLSGNIETHIAKWHSADYLQAAEKLHAELQFSLNYRPQTGFTGQVQLHLSGGELLINKLYLNLQQTPLTLSSHFSYHKGKLQLQQLQAQEEHLQFSGDLIYNTANLQLEQLHITQFSGAADNLYRRYLKPLLASDNLFADSELQGSFYASGDWQHKQGLNNAALILHHIAIKDRQDRFHFPNIDGQIGQSGQSQLNIAASTWRKLPLGASTLHFRWQEKQIALQQAWRIPILDGALVLKRLNNSAKQNYLLKLSLEPIDLAALSRALELPIFHGNISAENLEVLLNSNSLALQQPLHLNIFDGLIQLNDLRIKQAFSNQPRLDFSLNLEKIDLQRLTAAFNLAEIRGRISGYIHNVSLINWRPVAFDASILTDSQNAGERRISHEAVQLLSQAGGSSAALGQFVRVLNSFPYEKLGFNASLRGDRLHLSGVEEHPSGGFYLVKGKGLPHLDIIGHQRDSSYRELIERLKSASNSEAPVIE